MLIRLFSYITVGEYMKIERLDDKHYFIFLNIMYLNDIQINKDDIIRVVSEFLKKIKNKLLLNGFYKVKVYLEKCIGLFLDLIQIEDSDYYNYVDFRIVVYLDEKIYFRTKDYFLLPRNCSIYYFQDYFYCDVSDIDNILSVIEFGDFIYGANLYSVMYQWKKC